MKHMAAGLLTVICVFGAAATSAAADDANLQTLTDEQKAEIEKLGKHSLHEQIVDIKKHVGIELIASGRKGGDRYFEELGPAKRKLEEITDVEGLYGKAVCGSGGKLLIADDAPPSTLLHEYIHHMQMADNKRWCELDGKVLESGEKRERAVLYHRFEYETLKTLWDMRKKLTLNFEDNLILVEGLHREADIFKSLGIKTLSDEEASQLASAVDDIHSKIQSLTWMTKTREDAGGVMQKMEVVSLKSCVEQTSGESEAKKIRDCVARRCSLEGGKCMSDAAAAEAAVKKLDSNTDLFSKIIAAWIKPPDKETAAKDDDKIEKPKCTLGTYHDELIDHVEDSTPCWKTWFSENGEKDVPIKIKPVIPSKELKGVEVPKLAIDNQIEFYKPANPESFIATAYCYFIFEKVARFETLPIDQFAYATLGASIPMKRKHEYLKWLEQDPQGKSCSALVHVFAGDEPSDWSEFGTSKKYVLIINPVATLSGGLDQMEKALLTDLNHERLHIIYGEDKAIKNKVKNEWNKLSDAEKEKFKTEHASYNFQDQDVLFKEYFSYTRQAHPKKLF